MKEIYADIEQNQALYRFKETHKDRFMLRLDHADGRITCIEYNHLAMVKFEGGSVVIQYIHTTVKITGRNLRDLGLAIGRRETGLLVEQHNSSNILLENEMFIDRIEVTEQ